MRNVLEWLEADEANLPDKIAFADVNKRVNAWQKSWFKNENFCIKPRRIGDK